MDEKTLKYFSDNKNFAKLPQKRQKKKDDTLQVVDDQIVMNLDTGTSPEEEIVTSYTYMKNKGNRKKWSREETGVFYRALMYCGMDFSMMNILFPDRTRGNLKDKYKRESRLNAHNVEDALSNYRGVNLEELEKLKKIIEKRKLLVKKRG